MFCVLHAFGGTCIYEHMYLLGMLNDNRLSKFKSHMCPRSIIELQLGQHKRHWQQQRTAG